MYRKRPFCISRRGVFMEQRQNRVWGSKKGRAFRLVLRLSKNFVFPTICVLTLQNTDVRKFPCENFLPLKV